MPVIKEFMPPQKILVTFSTRAFWIRQQFLNISAISNGIVNRTEQWTPTRLSEVGFHNANPDISLKERGAGFWSWKPFIIEHALNHANDGDVIFYSDVGRMKVLLLRTSLDPFIEWMDREKQDCIPGVVAPWHGPISKWARADTLDHFGCTEPSCHQSPQMQASFSVWRKTPEIMSFVTEWKNCCFNRTLVSDDPNPSGQNNLPNFMIQYGDQTLLSLLTLKKGMKGLQWLNSEIPPFMDKSPEDWLSHMGGNLSTGAVNKLIHALSRLYVFLESFFRQSKVS